MLWRERHGFAPDSVGTYQDSDGRDGSQFPSRFLSALVVRSHERPAGCPLRKIRDFNGNSLKKLVSVSNLLTSPWHGGSRCRRRHEHDPEQLLQFLARSRENGTLT